MARKSSVEKNERRKRLAKKYAGKRERLLAIANDQSLTGAERMEARFKLQKLPRNSHPNRIRNRCNLTGRPRGYYRELGISRIALRDLASIGMIPGMTKSSW